MQNKTEKQENALKPCPFCGGEAHLVEQGDHHGAYYELGCKKNGCLGHWAYYAESPDDTPIPDAIAAWSTRTPAVPQISEETIKAALTAFRHEEDVMGGSGGAAMRAALTASTGTASQWRGKAIPSMDVERRLRFAFMEGFAAGVENPDDLGNEEEMGFAYTASDTQAYIDHGEAGYPDPSLATPPTAAQVKGE